MEDRQGQSFTVSFPSVASLPPGHTSLNLTLSLMSSWVPVSVLPAISTLITTWSLQELTCSRLRVHFGASNATQMPPFRSLVPR